MCVLLNVDIEPVGRATLFSKEFRALRHIHQSQVLGLGSVGHSALHR